MLFEDPTYLVQIGHNGHKLTVDLLKGEHCDGAILSPADYSREKNGMISASIRSNGGTVLFDPQFYIPRTERPKFSTYDYYQEFGGEDFETEGVSAEFDSLNKQLIDLQDDLEVDAYVSPARYLDTFSDYKIENWMEISDSFMRIAGETGRDIPIFLSLPTYQKSLVDVDQRNKLLNMATTLDPDGFYVSAEFDSEVRYPLTGASNVYSLLELVHSLRNNRYEVLVGHTHQVAHLLFAVGANAFASGHYNNLRSFDTRRFDPENQQEGGRIVIKYYSDKLLNELRVDPDLDLMYQKDDFDIEMVRTESPYDSDLFSTSIPPSTTGWKLRDGAWDHYCWSCHQIAKRYRVDTLEEKVELAEERLESAQELYETLNEELGMVTEPEGDIYADWGAAFSLMKKEMFD